MWSLCVVKYATLLASTLRGLPAGSLSPGGPSACAWADSSAITSSACRSPRRWASTRASGPDALTGCVVATCVVTSFCGARQQRRQDGLAHLVGLLFPVQERLAPQRHRTVRRNDP